MGNYDAGRRMGDLFVPSPLRVCQNDGLEPTSATVPAATAKNQQQNDDDY